jgi:hypothetical protein
MQFADQTLSVDTPFGPTEVCVTGDALHVWWGEGADPKMAPGCWPLTPS